MTNQKSLFLNAKIREIVGNNIQTLRENGLVPAVLYGHKVANINLEIDEIELQKLLAKISESDLIDLIIADKPSVKVLIHDISYDPLKNTIKHLDFYQVNMKEKITTRIELNFINESPAVKDLGGVLVKTLDAIEVECLPNDLISHIDIDLSFLKEIGSIIRAKDLAIPQSLTLLTDPETVIVLTEEPKKEIEKPIETATTPETGPIATETKDNTAVNKEKENKDK